MTYPCDFDFVYGSRGYCLLPILSYFAPKWRTALLAMKSYLVEGVTLMRARIIFYILTFFFAHFYLPDLLFLVLKVTKDRFPSTNPLKGISP